MNESKNTQPCYICDTPMIEQDKIYNNTITKAFVCPKCGEVVLSPEEVNRLLKLQLRIFNK